MSPGEDGHQSTLEVERALARVGWMSGMDHCAIKEKMIYDARGYPTRHKKNWGTWWDYFDLSLCERDQNAFAVSKRFSNPHLYMNMLYLYIFLNLYLYYVKYHHITCNINQTTLPVLITCNAIQIPLQ